VRANKPLLSGKDNQQHLPHLWDPPPENESPRDWEGAGASEKDRLAGSIEKTNSDATEVPQENYSQPKHNPQSGSENFQKRICQRCHQTFEPRKGSGGKAQKFCSTACRKAFHANTPPNVYDAAIVGENVGKDVGKNTPKNVGKDVGKHNGPDFEFVGRTADTCVPESPKDQDSKEFSWSEEIPVVPSQPAIAVYFNPNNDVVIRQEAPYPDDDQWVYIRRENLPRLIRRLQEMMEGGA
jgi:hypothetical protein